MSKIMIWCGGLALAGVVAGGGQPAVAGPAGDNAARPTPHGGRPSWGKVIGLPGLAALDKGGWGRVEALACSSAGNCVAGGHYGGKRAPQQGFVAIEKNGPWGKATGVPGLPALNASGFAATETVSCPSANYCVAGGYYGNEGGHDTSGFVAVLKNGVWGKAKTFPADDGDVGSIFCLSAGNCLAGGSQAPDYFYPFEGYVAEERNGHWGPAKGLPGLRTLNKGQGAEVDSVWCASLGNCTVGGYYSDRNSDLQGFLAVERNGTWGTATAVPGLWALNTDGNSAVNSLSCTSARNCVAGGYYTPKTGRSQAFLVVERNGTWGKAAAVPGLAALNKGGGATMVRSVDCTRAGSCTVGGFYADGSHHRQGFVTSEDNGTWGTPIPLPGLAALNKGGSAEVEALSCPTPSTCAAGGTYVDGSRHRLGFVTEPG